MDTKWEYNFGGFLEEKVLEYEIDNNDLQILSYINLMFSADKMEMIKYEDEYYVWLKAEKIVEDNPRLRIKRRALETRIAYLVEKGLIKKIVKCDEKNVKKTYYRITDKYREMLFTTNLIGDYKEENFDIKNECENLSEIDNKVSVIKDNDNSNIYKEEYIELFNYWNSKNIRVHRGITKDIEKEIKKALKDNTIDEIKTYIDRYDLVIKDNNYFFKTHWTLVEFLKQKNAMNDFKDDGSKWINYINSTSGKKKQEQQMIASVGLDEGWKW